MIIVPTAASTFGDSTTTEGPFRRYVLAQFREDADFDWVGRVRALLIKDELKYKDFRVARPKLRQDRDLWSRIEKGVGQATVVVIDPGEFEQLVLDALRQDDIERAGTRERAIIEGCATEVIATTPVTYLPENLSRQLGWPLTQITSLATFAPAEILNRLGGGLDKALVFAARAHAVFDVPRLEGAASTQAALTSPSLARVVLPEVLNTARAFDAEHPASAALLNEASEQIASAMTAHLPLLGSLAPQPLVREVDSKGIDALQASDIAAGWAREALEVAEVRSLGDTFERVWFNGRRLK
jgi:hypothetical protein